MPTHSIVVIAIGCILLIGSVGFGILGYRRKIHLAPAIIGIFMGLLTIGVGIYTGNEENTLCNEYCSCIESEDCNYTFNYTDVKGCDCDNE